MWLCRVIRGYRRLYVVIEVKVIHDCRWLYRVIDG